MAEALDADVSLASENRLVALMKMANMLAMESADSLAHQLGEGGCQ